MQQLPPGDVIQGIDSGDSGDAVESCVGRDDDVDVMSKARSDVQPVIGAEAASCLERESEAEGFIRHCQQGIEQRKSILVD